MSHVKMVGQTALDLYENLESQMMVSKTLRRACHLEVASTIVHGANSDSVSSSISSVAAR